MTERAEFIFLRHAESMANAQASTQIADPILTPRGLQEAASLPDWIAPRNVKAIYTSNTSRARATTSPLEEAYGVKTVEVSDIDEWNLGMNGKVDQWKFQEMLQSWCQGNLDVNLEGAPNSETLRDLIARVVPAYQAILKEHRDDGGAVIVVGHGGAISWTMPSLRPAGCHLFRRPLPMGATR